MRRQFVSSSHWQHQQCPLERYGPKVYWSSISGPLSARELHSPSIFQDYVRLRLRAFLDVELQNPDLSYDEVCYAHISSLDGL